MKSAAQLHWDYFLLLEKDLIAISETLELNEKNYDSFGPRLAQLILATGSELDVALKSLAAVLCPQHEAATIENPNMGHFKSMISQYACSQFATARVAFLRSEIVLIPWSAIADSSDCSFIWWSNYNNIKHKRSEYYEVANLKTALELISALFVVVAYLCEAAHEPFYGFTQIIDWESHEHMPSIARNVESQ